MSVEALTSFDQDILTKGADNIRVLAAAMVEQAKSGHPGGAMGGADYINVLFSEFLRFDPANPHWKHRDRFFMDPGHMSPMLYAQLGLLGKYSMEELSNFRQWGSPTSGHPEVEIARMVENTSGPLGQGHAFGLGAAIAERFLVARFGEWMAHKTYVYISDGGVQEEISQGVGRIAGFLGLHNLIMFYDANDIQLSTTVAEVTMEDTAAKYKAWGWNVLTIDGHDVDQIRQALTTANAETYRPTLIIGKTIMGKGAVDADGGSYEGKCSTHGQPLTNAGASFADTISGLGGDPENPFQVFEEVKAYYETVNVQKAAAAAKCYEVEKAWATENPELAAKMEQFFSGKVDFDQQAIQQGNNIATRAASAQVFKAMGEQIENMIVASADLADSDKTEAFLKQTTAFKKGDFTGQFLQAGVAELTMAAVAVGMGLHGGVVPVCATFFVFSDYMKPVIRMAALMQVPVKFVWTHDSFRVGEDGPTHQPIEQEAQLRLMEHLKNHHDQRSFLALRPADAAETTQAWLLALATTDRPVGLILSRQNIKDLPVRAEALTAGVQQGAYVVKEEANADVCLIANGSEVSTLVAASDLLGDRVKCRIVSVISEGLFRDQSEAYQEEVLPSDMFKIGLTAGLPVTLQGLVNKGKVFGLDHFGYSAPAGVLDDKFGFTPEKVAANILSFFNH
ncbi:transketolase [Persicobacter diffluens]|uniref:transketolase n=1 Tax=Persicobacter diffluens TaxID=981 RepID=A0AAN4W323_9BACT|nr:transketolase [Persicobacter diffluens]